MIEKFNIGYEWLTSLHYGNHIYKVGDTHEHILISRIGVNAKVETQKNTKIDFNNYDSLQHFISIYDLKIVENITRAEMEYFRTKFDDESNVLINMAYKMVDNKISQCKSFDQVAFLCGTLKEFHFLAYNNTIVTVKHSSSFIPPANDDGSSINMSEMFFPYKDKSVKWNNSTVIDTKGIVKNHNFEELLIILDENTQYITKDELRVFLNI